MLQYHIGNGMFGGVQIQRNWLLHFPSGGVHDELQQQLLRERYRQMWGIIRGYVRGCEQLLGRNEGCCQFHKLGR
jgi:hypothetical protein